MTASIIVRIVGDVTGFNAAMDKAKAKITAAKVAFQTAKVAVDAFKTSLMVGGASLIALIVPTIMATNSLKEYDSNVRRFMALTGSSTTMTNLDKLNKKFGELAITYGESAENVTAMAIEFAKAGFSADTISNQLLDPALKLAIANQMDSATAAEIATYAWQLWGKEVGSFAKMANMMQVAANESIMDVEDLAEAFEYVGSAAVLNNFTFQEFLAIAGGVSQIAAKMGESFRSLFINMMRDGQTLATTLNAPEIMEDGKVNLMKLVDVLERGEFSLNQWNEAMGMWGLRPATNLAQIRLSAEEIQRIFESLGSDTTALDRTAGTMALSFDRIMTSIKETLIYPLRDAEVMETIRTALIAVRESLSSPGFTIALQNIVLASSTFVTTVAPKLIEMLQKLLDLAILLLPTLETFANYFIWIAEVAIKAGAGVWVFIYSGLQFLKIAPQWAAFLAKVGTDSEYAGRRMMFLSVGLSAIMGGFAMIMTSADPLARAVGVMVVALGALVTMLSLLAIVEDLLNPATIGLAIAKIAIIGAAAATIGGAVALAAQGPAIAATPKIPQTPYVAGNTPTYQNTTTDNSQKTYVNEQNNYYPDVDTLSKDLDSNGVPNG